MLLQTGWENRRKWKKGETEDMFFSGKRNSDEWVLDSGTNSHIVNDLNYLNWKKIEIKVG